MAFPRLLDCMGFAEISATDDASFVWSGDSGSVV